MTSAMTLGDDVVFATLNYQRKLNPMAVDGPHPVRNCGVAFMALARNCRVAFMALARRLLLLLSNSHRNH